MKKTVRFLAMGGCLIAALSVGANDYTQVAFRDASTREEDSNEQSRIVAICVIDGAQDRFIITAGLQLVRITQAGEATVIGVVIPPTSDEYVCMIKTSGPLVGVTGKGNLVNTDDGKVVGTTVAVK